ncbi:IclR family transcriptional regulator [Streptomyces microflavus]|uniref:IclR family transcriptional regulator n=1 Tax=Streptomyces microflavus TaxID=1919 RepID=UPI002DDB7854|nr:IclR family transcriptional regulator [Streptomyces microflavus]WSA64461.1 IclR family transcriptional regulator [Streptomyces microflavus]
MTATGDYTIASLDTGLRAMRLFLTHDTLTVTETAERLSVGRSTAHRVLSTLESRGFAIRDTSGRGYAAGPELVRLGRPAGFGRAARERLGPVLEDAAGRTGETVWSVALIGDQVIVTDGRESPHPVRVALELGRTGPAHAGSGGLLLLSRMTADQVCALYPHEELEPVTPATLTSRAALLDELALIRRRGHAVGRGMSVPGMTTVAVSLAGSSWRDRLALVAAAPADRSGDAALAERAERLKESAALLGPAQPS